MFTLKFETDNAAFEDGGAAEVARILRKVAQQVETGAVGAAVLDSNGNRVGDWSMSAVQA